MRFAGAGLADEVDHFAPVNEVEAGQRHDAVAVERGLECEVEAGERLDRGEPGHLQRRLDPAPLAHAELFAQQGVDRLDRADLAALELLDHLLQRLQRARHAQADQAVPDALDRGIRRSNRFHAAAPSAANRRPTAS